VKITLNNGQRNALRTTGLTYNHRQDNHLVMMKEKARCTMYKPYITIVHACRPMYIMELVYHITVTNPSELRLHSCAYIVETLISLRLCNLGTVPQADSSDCLELYSFISLTD